MDLRKVLRLSCLTIAGFFWASCGDDSDSSTGVTGVNPGIEPESSSDALGTVSSDSQQFSSSSSEEQVPESSSGPDLAQSSSSDGERSSSTEEFIMAKDSSVTCTRDSALVSACYSPDAAPSYSCMDLQEFLKKDTLVSKKILNSWEEKLMSCGAIKDSYATLYGIFYDVCGVESKVISEMKCSDGRSYRNFKLDSNLVYTSTEEYDTAHGIVPEDLMQNCPQSDFETFVDMLPEVRKKLYDIFTDESYCAKYIYTEKNAVSDAGKEYIESLLDHENKTIKGGRLSPFYIGDVPEDGSKDYYAESSSWWIFDGYVAKTETCSDGASQTREIYESVFMSVLSTAIDILLEKAKRIQ